VPSRVALWIGGESASGYPRQAMTMDELQTWPTQSSESPFRLPLVPHPQWPSMHIRVFDGNAGFVARLVPALQLESSDRLLLTTKALHEELERFGVAIPPRIYLLGSRHSDGMPQGFIVARVVEGTDLVSALATDPTLAEEADGLCCALADYYQSKYDSGGARLSDLKLEQFVVGSVDGIEALWMVDLDPGYVETDPATQNPRHLASLHWRVAEVATILIRAEQAAGQTLVHARARFDTLLVSGIFDHPSARGRAEALARGVADGAPVDGAEWMQAQLRSEG
jgi:hypothetical protein